MLRTWTKAALVVLLVCASACGSSKPSTPAPPAGPGGESITGRERIGWDQVASSAAELATLRYAMYVDGNRVELTDVSCATTAGAAGFACSARLPAMSAGSHTLEIAAFTDAGGVIESTRSAPLRVTVTGSTSPAAGGAIAQGDRIQTNDGIALVLEAVAPGIPNATDIAFAPDGRILLTDSDGSLTMIDPAGERQRVLDVPATRAAGGLLGVALSPDFSTSGHVFVAAGTSTDAGNVVRVMRYRVRDGAALEGIVLLPDVRAAAQPAAGLRTGPDGKLYAMLGGTDDEGALRLSEWSGKILRLELDGRTPADQPAVSPVMWSGIRVPRGLGWSSDGRLWTAEEGVDGAERLRGLDLAQRDGVKRATPAVSYALPHDFAGRSLAVYASETIPAFTGNVFLGGESGYLLRISFEDEDRTRAKSSERLLEGRLKTVRAVGAGRDGALYFCNEDGLWRLTASAPLLRRESR